MAVDFPYLDISNCNASVRIAQNGAQIFGFDRVGEAPVIWISPKAIYKKGFPLRGGIPICWPWFGPHPEGKEKPQHGFVRIMPWELKDFSESDKGVTRSSFSLSESKDTLRFWPYRFRLTLSVEVSKALTIRLTTENTDDKPFEITQALHTYFFVGDVHDIEIQGLDGHEYVDKVKGGKEGCQKGSLVIKSETDRVYRHKGRCRLLDKRLDRVIVIDKKGSGSTVVWNPWKEKARQMADFPDDGFRNMVCIEAANTMEDRVRIEPGQDFTLEKRIEVFPLQ